VLIGLRGVRTRCRARRTREVVAPGRRGVRSPRRSWIVSVGTLGRFSEQLPGSANNQDSDNNRGHTETPRGMTDAESESEASAIALEKVREHRHEVELSLGSGRPQPTPPVSLEHPCASAYSDAGARPHPDAHRELTVRSVLAQVVPDRA
jgi:hypothetical protein